jgi:WhiB family redox-sensing transcriptional regulator
MADLSWTEKANCIGVATSLFFPERGESHAEPQAVCAGCEVKRECLDYAMRHRIQTGIWGGESERARRRLRRERNRLRAG